MVHTKGRMLEVPSVVVGNRKVVSRFLRVASLSLAAAVFVPAVVCAQQSQSSQQPGSPQQQTPPSSASATQSPAPATSITIPAGTRIEMVLTQDVDSRAMHRGDQLHAQITNPVTADGQGAIPPGSFVQGKIEKLTSSHHRADIVLKSASVIFPDGDVLPVPGTVTVRSGEYTAWSNPSENKGMAAIFMPMIGGGVGTLIGSQVKTTDTIGMPPNTLTSKHTSITALAVGSAVGLGVGLVAMAALLHTHQFYMAAGSPVEMELPTDVVVPPAPAPAPGS